MLLYQRGLFTRDVAGIMEEFFGKSMSRDTINNLASSCHHIRKKVKKRPLNAYTRLSIVMLFTLTCSGLIVIAKKAYILFMLLKTTIQEGYCY
ncbi:MAG: transposase [Bacteroidota bacterium]